MLHGAGDVPMKHVLKAAGTWHGMLARPLTISRPSRLNSAHFRAESSPSTRDPRPLSTSKALPAKVPFAVLYHYSCSLIFFALQKLKVAMEEVVPNTLVELDEGSLMKLGRLRHNGCRDAIVKMYKCSPEVSKSLEWLWWEYQ